MNLNELKERIERITKIPDYKRNSNQLTKLRTYKETVEAMDEALSLDFGMEKHNRIRQYQEIRKLLGLK